MLSPNQKPENSNMVIFALLFMAFLTGIASSFQLPTLSLFLSQQIQVTPFLVGLFYAVNAIMGILVSQLLAKYSDKQQDRRKILLFCCLVSIVGCVIFAYSRNYYVLLFLGTLLMGLGAAVNPQTFAFAREYNESNKKESLMFTTILRAQISLAWIVGPPLSFSIALHWGFDFLYLTAALAFMLCAILTLTILPQVSRQQVNIQTSQNLSVQNVRKSTLYLFLVCFLAWTCNSMYLINMPLYVIHQLGLPDSLAGILMASAAGLEIPVMLLAGYLTKFLAKKTLIYCAIIAGLIFYMGLLMGTQPWWLIGLQLFNGIFIGVLASIGMIYFQDLMPQQMGSATTLFTNAAKSSWILGGPLAGIITQFWHYQTVFYIAIGLILVALVCMWRVRSV
ncbi:SET family sugar efflux transporter-like MFS transporter [Volucribacter psittacicida]|uniref:SET family sugar efflux transporter-like MFS transporter n=1 Tax=Volucribacter psittacicida TaxID=203482 RepID=A0A4R1FR22_9PAST|nr:MFS transporter [Volucribacter psittacicida]TCJ94758.1 SET family sugar efflux transporter-like MFS transporter [Volucribacter psittacicida]